MVINLTGGLITPECFPSVGFPAEIIRRHKMPKSSFPDTNSIKVRDSHFNLKETQND